MAPCDLEFARRVIVVALVALTASVLVALAILAAQLWLLLFGASLLALLLRGLGNRLAAYTPLGPRSALTVVVVLLLGSIAGAGVLLAPSVLEQTGEFLRLLPDFVEDLRRWTQGLALGPGLRERLSEALQRAEVVEPVTEVAYASLEGLYGIAVVVIAGLYLAVNPRLYVEGFVRLMPVTLRRRAAQVVHGIGHTLQMFLLGRIVSMLAVGAATGVGLELLGIPLAALLGVVAGLLTFVPYAGPIAAGIPIAIVALTVGLVQFGYAMLLYTGIQMIEGFFITPMVQERVVHLPPVTTLAAEILMGMLFGPLGVVLSVPLAAAVLVVVRELYVHDLLERAATSGESS